ncbi:MAG: hypothetical protein ABIP78_02095 [Pyrinomonadaceae bacterium]
MREKTRAFLRRRLDAYEGRADKKDERYYSWLGRGMDALDHRPTLKRFFYVLLGLELLYWIFVLVFPVPVMGLIDFLNEWSNKGLVFVFGAVFGTGLYISYVLFRFKFPDLEDNQPGDGPVIGAYSQQIGVERKFRVWIASVIVGVLNILALMAVEIFRVYGL